jgi:uncharacterized SAM-binding protein YcdF (DUF218 family)
MFVCTLLCSACWLTGLFWFTSQIPRLAAADPRAEIAIVLTGGPGRMDYGMTLLADQHVGAVFISGVGKGVSTGDILRLLSPSLRRRIPAAGNTVFLGDDAVNTIGNAEETRRWLQGKPYRTALLVTSNYHMPRSLSEFREAIPEVTWLPAPVIDSDFRETPWMIHPESRRLVLSEYHKFLMSKLRHWFLSATEAP